MLEKATTSFQAQDLIPTKGSVSNVETTEALESEDDEPGPLLPQHLREQRGGAARVGPAIPSIQDLELKRGI